MTSDGAPQGARRYSVETLVQRLAGLALIALGVVLLVFDPVNLLVEALRGRPVVFPAWLVLGRRLVGLVFIAFGVLLIGLRLFWKLLEFLIAFGVLLIGLLLSWDALQGTQVAAAFSRVGGATRVETAVEASRFWLTPPQHVVLTLTNAPREIMWKAAQCAMVYDAPLLLVPPDRKRQGLADRNRQRLVDRTIEDLQTTAGSGDPPRGNEFVKPVYDQLAARKCVDPQDQSYNPLYAEGLSTLEVPNRQLDLPGIEAEKKLAPTVVFAVAKTPQDPPDVAVALALAAHMASEDRPVSLVVVPRYLEADRELERELRERRELVTGGIVLGQTEILPEDTHALLRQVLTSTGRTGLLGYLSTTLGSLQDLIAPLLALLAARAVSQIAPELRSELGTERIIRWQEGGNIMDRSRGLFGRRPRRGEPPPPTKGPFPYGLTPDQQVTVWLRSGWKVTGIVEHGQDLRVDTGATTALQLRKAKLMREGLESEQAGRVLMPVDAIELISVKVEE